MASPFDPNVEGDAIGAAPGQAGLAPSQPAPASLPGNILNPVLQGATLGFSDEIAGMGAAMIPGGNDYTEGRDESRADTAAFAERNPELSLAAEFAGGFAVPGLGGARTVVKGADALRRGGRAAAIGATEGAAAGAGYSEDGTLQGMAQGALLGGISGPFATAIGSGLRAGSNMVGKTLGSRGSDERLILKNLERGDFDLSTEQGRARFETERARLGPEGMMADVGEPMGRLTDAMAVKPGPAGPMINEALDVRQGGRNRRVTQAADSELGESQNFMEEMRAHALAREFEATPDYKAAKLKPIVVRGDLAEFLQRPRVKQAYKKALEDAELAGESLPPMSVIFGDGTGMNMVDTESLHKLKVALDVMIDKNTKVAELTGARTIKPSGIPYVKAKNQLVKMIGDQNDEYDKARLNFSSSKDLETAAIDGKSYAKLDDYLTGTNLERMNPDQREFFRKGAAKAIRDQIRGAEDGAAAYRRIFGSELKRDKIRALFPDDESFGRFERAMERERTFSETRAAVQGNSATTQRQQDQLDLNSDSIPSAAKKMLANAWYDISKGNPVKAREMARMLTGMRRADIDRLMNRAETSNKAFASVMKEAIKLMGVNYGAGAVAPKLPHEQQIQ